MFKLRRFRLTLGGMLILVAVIAVGIAYSRWISELTYPFLVSAQVLPKIALAPLFLIWFGFGLTPKVVIAALIAFFPIVINTARGLQSVEVELIQYMRSLGADWREIFFKISLPWALPYVIASFKIAITLAVVGAVVGKRDADAHHHDGGGEGSEDAGADPAAPGADGSHAGGDPVRERPEHEHADGHADEAGD